MLRNVFIELRRHVPYTAVGALFGVLIMALFVVLRVPRTVSEWLFWFAHPLHVLLSAYVTASMYRIHTRGGVLPTLIIGYIGSIGIATLSDSVIPFLGEWLLQMPNRGWHIGFIEKWWLVNPLAFLGIALAFAWPKTHLPHVGHVWLSIWASLFHMTMAIHIQLDLITMLIIALFLFLAVLLPCCVSDIVFPLLFARECCPGQKPEDKR